MSKDKILFTPGPLTTSQTVKTAMLRDLGSRDFEFIQIVRNIRERLLNIGEVAAPAYEAIPVQGSGTFGLEAVLASTVAPNGKILSVVNGAYGRRITQLAHALKIQATEHRVPEHTVPDPRAIDEMLATDPQISHVVMAHCETTTGIINPVREVGEVVLHHNRTYFVDAMSSFGGMPLPVAACNIDYLVSSANKCLEGVPGFSFVLARREKLLAIDGFARSLSFDLLAQWEALERSGQFRFTPPTHALLAFHQALLEFEAEGGVEGRSRRYRQNHSALMSGMEELGFKAYLAPQNQSHIITSFYYLKHENFNFEEFYARLNARGFVIYPGKVSNADCFRIGTIGRISVEDVRRLLCAIQNVLTDMAIS